MNASSAAPRSRDLQSYLGSVMVAVLVILPASIVLLVLSLPVQQAWAGRARKLAQREIEVEPLLTPDSSIEASLNNSSPMASSSVPWTLCSLEGGPGSIRHEEFVSRLDGRKVVFLGDCLLRYCIPRYYMRALRSSEVVSTVALRTSEPGSDDLSVAPNRIAA